LSKFTTIQSCFEEKADYDEAKIMTKYICSKFQFYGIKTKARKGYCKVILKEDKKMM